MPIVADLLPRLYALLGPYLPPPWTHRGYDFSAPCRPSLHHAGGHFWRRGRRIVDADHHVHDLWRVPPAFRRRKILHRFLDGADGRHAQQRRTHRGAVLVPARRTIRFGRRHDGDHRCGRLSDDGARRFREERRRWVAGGRRARRDPVAAGARGRRVLDRRVPQDQLPRCDLDGDDPDLSVLSLAPVHGRARRQAFRRHHGAIRYVADARTDDPALRLSLHVADRRHRVHDGRLFADALGVLLDADVLRAQRAHARDRAGAAAASAGGGARRRVRHGFLPVPRDQMGADRRLVPDRHSVGAASRSFRSRS